MCREVTPRCIRRSSSLSALGPGTLQHYQIVWTATNEHLLTNRPDGLVKHGLEPLLGQGRALQVLDSTNILGHLDPLGVPNGRHSTRIQYPSASTGPCPEARRHTDLEVSQSSQGLRGDPTWCPRARAKSRAHGAKSRATTRTMPLGNGHHKPQF